MSGSRSDAPPPSEDQQLTFTWYCWQVIKNACAKAEPAKDEDALIRKAFSYAYHDLRVHYGEMACGWRWPETSQLMLV